MKKWLSIGGIVLFIAQVSYAALPSLSGGSGLILSRTTDVLRRGAFNASLFINTNIYTISSDTIWPGRNTEISPILGFNYGVLDTFEVGLVMPFVIGAGIKSSQEISFDPQTGSGLGNIKLILKYAVFPNSVRKKTFNFGLTGYAGLPTASNNLVGSGDLNAGAELNTALFYGRKKQFGTYLNFGWENGDYYLEPCPAGEFTAGTGSISCPNDGVISGSKLVGSFGFDYYPRSIVGITFEVLGSSFRKYKDEDLYAVVGAKYIPTDYLAIDGGVGVGLPPNQVKPNTDYTLTLGASYLFGREKAKPAPAAPPSKVEKKKPVTIAKPSVPPVAPPPPPPAKVALKVMVLDGCATANAAEPAAKVLKDGGFNVVKIARIKERKYTETQVMFPREHTKEAVDISRALPGKQKMARLPKPRTDADIVVIAGCDQLPAAAPAVPPPAPKVTAPPAPPPAPPVQKKSIKEMRVTVFNGCRKAGLGEEAAKKLLLAGYNITKVGNAEKMTYKVTEINYIQIYDKEAKEIAGKLNVKPVLKPAATVQDAEISVTLGCDFTTK